MSSWSHRNWDREREQVHQIHDLITINTEDHATLPPLVPVVSDYESYYDSIGAHQVSEVEPLSDDGPPLPDIKPEPPPQK